MLAIRATWMFDGERFANGSVTLLIDDDGRIAKVEQGLPDLPENLPVIDHPGGGASGG